MKSATDVAYYIDTSALVKLVEVEESSSALHQWVDDHHPELVSSDLLRTEFIRAVARVRHVDPIYVEDALAAIDTLPAPTELFDAAGAIGDPGLRTLDALHLATAVGLGESCTGIITSDQRLAEAATAAGLDVYAPG